MTLGAAVEIHLDTVRHLVSWPSKRSELRAWLGALGPDREIATVRKLDVLRVRSGWVAAGAAAGTANNRVRALCQLLETFDLRITGRLPPLRPAPARPPTIEIEMVDRVLQRLAGRGLWRARARLAVLAATGRRPAEVRRTLAADIDWRASTWRIRDSKGGWTPGGVALAGSGLLAWRAVEAADAWGPWNLVAWLRTLRRHGWPAGIGVYQLRHSAGRAMHAAGIDLDDVAAALGHLSSRMTRNHYVPIDATRQRASFAALDHARPIPSLADVGPRQFALPLMGQIRIRAVAAPAVEPPCARPALREAG